MRASQVLPPVAVPWLKRGFVLAVLVCAVSLVGMLSFVAARALVMALPGAADPSSPQIAAGQQKPAFDEQGNPLPAASNPNAPDSAPELAAWDGAGRVTVLLLGLDYRDWEQGEVASRSDTMILLTLDPLTKSAGMLSIPRDMWVAIPGFKHGKINTAYYLGDAYNLPGGGPGLAVKTVEQFLGIPINYYAQVDFGAFVRFIDEIGGVKIDVPAKLTIDLLGSGAQTKKTLQPGVQVLPGEWALAYARARYTEGGDFDRANRQQQVILGIRNRILSFELLPALISKAPRLYGELASGIDTNLSLEDVIKLALLAKDVPDQQIRHGVLDEKTVIFGRSPDNLSILVPIPDKVHLLREEIFTTSGSIGPQAPGDLPEQVQAEAAPLAVYNGSREAGLENRLADYLREKGSNLAQVGAADQQYGATTLIDHTGNPYLVKYLVELLSVQPGRIHFDYDPASPVGVELYLGYDAEGVALP